MTGHYWHRTHLRRRLHWPAVDTDRSTPDVWRPASDQDASLMTTRLMSSVSEQKLAQSS